jgi:hypothetical protein
MKWSPAILLIFIVACTGSLTEEQRQKVKDDMANHAIRKVSDAELTEAAFAKGREWISEIEKQKSDSAAIDSIVNGSEGKIHFVVPGKSNALAVEQQLIDAYISSPPGDVQDNVQKIRGSDGTVTDSILYSKPILIKRNDGVDVLTGVWNIWLSRKELIMAMEKK